MVAATVLAAFCVSDAATLEPADELVTVEITGFRAAGGDDPESAVAVYEYRVENHAADEQIVQMMMEAFAITPEVFGEREYADLAAQAMDSIAAGELGLQWSVEVQALDASGEVLDVSYIYTEGCGTRGGETLEHRDYIRRYEDDPVFTADDVAEVVVDTATLEVLPLFLSEIDEERCAERISGDR